LQQVNSYDANALPPGAAVNISINCSCGDGQISKDYGLFLTIPRTNATIDSLSNLSSIYRIPYKFLSEYNRYVDFAHTPGIAVVPVPDQNGSYHPLDNSGGGIGAGLIRGISISISFALLFMIIGVLYIYVYKHKKAKMSPLLQLTDKDGSANIQGVMNPYATPQGFTDITVDKSLEFTYEELAESTNDFSIANKIGEGGFGAVYYGELRGEKAAIKKMDMQATKAFLAELKVLTRVHHSNLVRLIGFCTEDCLFLAYEFMENGDLSQHLRGSGMEPLSWPARVQIALEIAKGLEYIHEHTVPAYIHRDIKSANILIDKNYHAKVADFGLTRLTEVGGASAQFPTRLMGTFGYMPPERQP
jgi:chitin elicitor receptor kinase 1